MSRLGDAFERGRREGRAVLVAYLMAGDPDITTTERLALACVRGGANILELGIPFSDPIADGPEIQAAGHRALKAGTRPRDVLDLSARLARQTAVPLVLMTYLNPVLAIGLDAFTMRAAGAGVDGLIVPDLSLEDSGEVRGTTDTHGIDLVQLVAPSSSPGRARALAAASRGFLYVVARYGTTGTRSRLPEDLPGRLIELRSMSRLPLAVGFGVSSVDHVRALAAAGADGVVVGSAIVQRVADGARPDDVEGFVHGLAVGLREARSEPLRGHGDLPSAPEPPETTSAGPK